MKVSRIEDYRGGWFIGDFEPSVLRTDLFEVGTVVHKKGEKWDPHFHVGWEYNYLVEGEMVIQGRKLTAGDVFCFDSFEVSDPVFLTDCKVVTVKVPSMPGDKFVVDGPDATHIKNVNKIQMVHRGSEKR